MRKLSSVVVLLLLLTGGCAQVSKLLRSSARTPTATHKATRLANITLDDATVEATFAIHNPNAMGLKLDGLDWAFAFDGQKLFDGKMPAGLQLPANGTSELKVPITIPFRAIPALVTTYRTKAEAPYKVQARASIKTPVGVLALPIGWEGMLPIPKLPSIALDTARIDSVTLTGARVLVQFGVDNPNKFALPLDALGGRVTVAGHQVAGLSLATPRPLAAGEKTLVQLPIDISFASAGFAVASAITSGSTTLGVSGQASVAGKALPMNLSTTLTR